MLESIANGDENAYTTVYLHYGGLIYDAAMVYLQNNTQAKEIVQEVFYKIWEKREGLRNVRKLQDYLFIIARNCIFDHLRKKAVEVSAYEILHQIQPIDVDNTDHRVRDRQFGQLLQSAIDNLPPQRRRIYQLAKEQGHSYHEIALQLGISAFTVKNQMAQALQYIRSYIHEHVH
ncbi:MAG TPA: RNA polymerase sigma-70 factor [Chitinophaga sp.]|uniref:RNA polymerase sigma factor n=1 Tax=Chitinophaga sp. TaxID=1869181 RepID=UPI002C629D5D|nr:RNA polymerase sigma-70 factor [Chitinophaga sp.]HVI46341.1 RNA polymerase sigma-70 factor [Chitinophaga sp.]